MSMAGHTAVERNQLSIRAQRSRSSRNDVLATTKVCGSQLSAWPPPHLTANFLIEFALISRSSLGEVGGGATAPICPPPVATLMLASTNLDLIVTVVVQYEDTIQFTVCRHDEISHVVHAFRQRLPRVLLHLNVEKLPTAQYSHKCHLISVVY